MTPEQRTLIRHHLGQIESVLTADEATTPPDAGGIIVDEGAGSSGVGIDPKPDADRTINGHSLYADEDGFATVPEWERIIQRNIDKHKLTPAQIAEVRLKTPKRLASRSVLANCAFPSAHARLKCLHNLNSRRRAGWTALGGDAFSHDAYLVTITEKGNTGPRDWNMSDDAWATATLAYAEPRKLVCEGETGGGQGDGAWASNHDPAQDVAYFNDLFQKRIDAILAPHGIEPQFGEKL